MQALDWRNAGGREIARGRIETAKAAVAVGANVTYLDRVRANFAEWPHAVLIQGAAPQVLGTPELGPVAFLHLDTNCALPEDRALEFFWPRLSPDGVVLFDDHTTSATTRKLKRLTPGPRVWESRFWRNRPARVSRSSELARRPRSSDSFSQVGKLVGSKARRIASPMPRRFPVSLWGRRFGAASSPSGRLGVTQTGRLDSGFDRSRARQKPGRRPDPTKSYVA